jgi:hypothetical protein
MSWHERLDDLLQGANAGQHAEVITLVDRMLARIERELPDEFFITETPLARCTDLIGTQFRTGATWNQDMCCWPCRVRLAIRRAPEYKVEYTGPPPKPPGSDPRGGHLIPPPPGIRERVNRTLNRWMDG